MEANQQEVLKLTKFNPEVSNQLADLLFGDKLEKREKWREFFKNNSLFYEDRQFKLLYDVREIAYRRIKEISNAKFFSIYDFVNDPINLFTCHEMIAMVDGSLATKFTVQNNLFGGTLMALSTEQHADFLKKVDSLDVMGCFCFTELGYGNNAPKMETTAVYDEDSDQFIIDCPTVMSQKYWITNGACHANYAIVFAQTIVKGKNEGVNAFIVQIREKSMN